MTRGGWRDPVTDPVVASAAENLDHSLAQIHDSIAGLPPEALNWRPAGDETNSISVLAVHALHSTRWWLSVATDARSPERDRPSEFEATAESADQLLELTDRLSDDCRTLLEGDVAFDAGASRTSASSHAPPETVTAAWALLHAIEHLREHVAHLQLTRQLWEARSNRP